MTKIIRHIIKQSYVINILVVIILLQLSCFKLSAQEKEIEIVKTLLDYRYKGGSGAFERDFFYYVDYNEISRQSCTVGTTVMSFTIGCDGTLGEFYIINPLNDYISSQLQKFFLMTKGNWNECNNSDYEYFEVPVLFTIEGLQTEAVGLITNYADKEGYPCKGDSYYHQEFDKFKEDKPKKALQALDELIKRNPYNELYVNQRDDLLSKFPKLRKKYDSLPYKNN